MNSIKQTRYYFLFTICLFAIVSCEPFNLAEANFPEVITGAGTPFTSSVTFESEVSGIQNGFLVDQCGHALFTESVSTPDFSLAFSIETSDGQCGRGSYENTFIDLQSNQTYFCRAFIQKDGKTIWGEEVSINTRAFNVVMRIDSFCINRNDGTAIVSSSFTFSNIPDKLQIQAFGFTWGVDTLPNIENNFFTQESGREVRNETLFLEGVINPEKEINHIRPFIVIGGKATYGTDTLFLISDFWTPIADLPLPTQQGVGFSIGDKGYAVLGDRDNSNFYEFDPSKGETGVWTQLPDLEGLRRNPVAFSIGGKGYVGLGIGRTDFWEFDPNSGPLGQWREVAEYPKGEREISAFFTLNEKGYIGLGSSNNMARKDWYEFDPSGGNLDSLGKPVGLWREMESLNLPNASRGPRVGFAIEDKGYVGLPIDRDYFFEFDPTTGNLDATGKPKGTWIEVTGLYQFPEAPGRSSVGFSIGSKGYICTGSKGASTLFLNKLWEFDPGKMDTTKNTIGVWTQRADLLGLPRIVALAFTIENKGYLGSGVNPFIQLTQDFWEYTPTLDQFEDIKIVDCN